MAAHDVRTLALSSSVARARRWLGLLAFALPVGIVAATLAFALRAEPAFARDASMWVFAGVTLSSALMWWWLDMRLRRVGVVLDGERLHVDGGIGRRDFALAELAADGVRTVDLSSQPELRPVVRTWGIGLPGLSSGWFRLRNGDKALCVLTDRNRTAVLRARDGTRILLSLADATALREALERERR